MMRLENTSRKPRTSATTTARPATRPHGGTPRWVNVVMNPAATPITNAKSEASATVMIVALSVPVFTVMSSRWTRYWARGYS